MPTIQAEVVESGQKHDTKGRKIADAARRAEVLAAYDASGLTQRAFARREGVNYYTLVNWLERRRQRTPRTQPVRFAQLRLGAGGPAAGLEVCLPGGIVVRGHDVGQLAALVKALGN